MIGYLHPEMPVTINTLFNDFKTNLQESIIPVINYQE
jgi:hypothetical protein